MRKIQIECNTGCVDASGTDLAQAKLGDTIRSLIPYLAVSMIALALVTYVPDISMGLVKLIAS